ncbi:MAG: hypothetical protein HFG34_04440 [Eubacterium sp.]|nr:hypothetical protein [Eubacterium sp.]
MSVCFTWIKNEKSYLIADTLMSSTQNIITSSYTPFHQRKEFVNGYYIEEDGLKIYEISNDMVIAVAGNVPSYTEILQQIYNINDTLTIHKLLELLQLNFMHLLENVKMLFLYKEFGKNKIIVWDGNCSYEPTNTSIPIFIGCGADNIKFTEAVKKAILCNNDHDSNQYLSLIISYVQCLSMKLKTIRNGFGGTFYGLFISSKIQWMRDLEYVLLTRNGRISQLISVIIRKSSVIISSSMENTTRLLTNFYKSTEWFSEYHNMKSVLRAVDTKEAFYYIFYGLKSNQIYLWEAKGILIRNDFRKWIKRGEKKVDYLYAIDTSLANMITSGKGKILEPQGHILSIIGSTYLSLDAVSTDVIKQLHKTKILVGYDYDFVALNCSSFNKDHIKMIRRNINNFYNIVVIDYDFFCKKILEENLAFYQDYNFDLTNMHLELLLRHCLQNDYYVEYSKIKIVVVKSTKDYIINNVNITSWFQNYHNCSFIITDNKEKDLSELLIYWIKEYYINEKYFHLGMNILIADNLVFGQILDLLVPLERRHYKCADWILVRLNNSNTSMPGGFNYVNEEWAFLDLLNLDTGYPLQKEIAVTEREQELLSGIGQNTIHDWTQNKSLFNNIKLVDPTK